MWENTGDRKYIFAHDYNVDKAMRNVSLAENEIITARDCRCIDFIGSDTIDWLKINRYF